MLPAWHKKKKKGVQGDKAVIFPPGNNFCVYVWVHVLNAQQSLSKISNPCKLKQVTVYQEKAEKPCCTISSIAFHLFTAVLNGHLLLGVKKQKMAFGSLWGEKFELEKVWHCFQITLNLISHAFHVMWHFILLAVLPNLWLIFTN